MSPISLTLLAFANSLNTKPLLAFGEELAGFAIFVPYELCSIYIIIFRENELKAKPATSLFTKHSNKTRGRFFFLPSFDHFLKLGKKIKTKFFVAFERKKVSLY